MTAEQETQFADLLQEWETLLQLANCPMCGFTIITCAVRGRETWCECTHCGVRTRGFFVADDVPIGRQVLGQPENYDLYSIETLKTNVEARKAWNRRTIVEG
jgi:uncharacterized protein YmfQ (DUF2313 family)